MEAQARNGLGPGLALMLPLKCAWAWAWRNLAQARILPSLILN